MRARARPSSAPVKSKAAPSQLQERLGALKPALRSAPPTRAEPAHRATPASSPSPPESQESKARREFRAAMRDVTPLKSRNHAELQSPRPHPYPRQRALDESAVLNEAMYAPTSLDLRLEGGEELTYLRSSMPRSVLRDLRRGRWVIQDELDLHGATRDVAREWLAGFLAQCRKRGLRCVRIIHGKGLGSPRKEPVLKNLVAGWLMNYDDVLAYCQAKLCDGGAGAVLVLLRPRP